MARDGDGAVALIAGLQGAADADRVLSARPPTEEERAQWEAWASTVAPNTEVAPAAMPINGSAHRPPRSLRVPGNIAAAREPRLALAEGPAIGRSAGIGTLPRRSRKPQA
jgi:hypothetical protein